MDRILIVDDNVKNIQVLGTMLSGENYEIEYAQDGKEAIDCINAEEFDLVLMDVMMPVMDGFEACEAIRGIPKHADVPIIFLTAKTDKESVVRGFQVGGQDYLTKPFDSHELIARVKTHIELKNSKKKLNDVNQWLEEEVNSKTQELKKAYTDLKQLEVAKADFLKILGHEMKTPLNGIVASLQMLKSRINEDDLVKILQRQEASTKRLEKVTNDALLITSLKTNKHATDIKQVAISKLVEYQLIKHSELISEKELSINFDDLDNELQVETDSTLLSETLGRLIKNAVEYSVNNTEIKIICELSGDEIVITIKDEGCGFKSSMLDKNLGLFELNNQAEDQKLGLDLYIVNLVVNTLGGKFVFGNNTDKGAYVKLHLPNK